MSTFEVLALLVACFAVSAIGDVARAIRQHASTNAAIAHQARADAKSNRQGA